MYVFTLQTVEEDDIVDTVEELGGKFLLHLLVDNRTFERSPFGLTGGCVEADACAEVFQLASADIGGHDDDSVLEVHLATQAVGQLSVVEYLQKDVEDIGMSLLNLVEQDDGVGLAPNLLGQLSALLVADVSRRRTDETRDGEFLHILAHIDADHVGLAFE